MSAIDDNTPVAVEAVPSPQPVVKPAPVPQSNTYTVLGYKLTAVQLILIIAVLAAVAYYAFKRYKSGQVYSTPVA